MGGIRPDFDPVAALAKARARLDAAKRATAGAVFAGPDFSVPALDGADLGTPAMVGLPARDVTGLRAPDLVRPPSGGGVSFAHPEQTTAEDVRRRRITAALHTDLPGGDETINAVRAVPGATMGMLGTVTGLVAPETTKSLVAQAQSVAGEPGVGTTLGGLATGLYTAGALGNVTAALVPKIGAALSSPTFGARWAANVGTFAPIDIASGLQEGRETGHPVQAIGRNLAMNAAGAALFEGGAQAFRSTMPRTVNAQQAADIANAPPPRVQRPPSQLVHPERPIFENPDPMAEAAVARAGQPIPTNKDGVPLDVLEAQAVPLPPEAYAGPERRMRIESISADDILNQHRRAADLPPTTAPLVPRVQSGTPRTGTVGGMQSVTRADFTRPPVADEAAVLERLAMQERSAASELAARELGTPPRMEGVAPILPMPGTKGRTKLVGGDEKFRYTDDTALQDEYDAVLERLDANNKTFNAGTTMWTRDDPNLGGVQRSGTSISGEAGRAKGGVSRDATYLGRIEEELNRRGIDPVDARERAYAARAARAKAAAAENLPASLRESQGPDRFNSGKGATPILSGLTGTGVGAAAGYATGDTPEERRRNALLGALAGGLGGIGLGKASELIGIRYAPQIRDWASRTYQGLLNDVHAADEFGRRVGRTEAVAQATATARGWQGRADWYIGKRGPAVGGPLTLKQVMLSAKGIEPEVQALAIYRHALELDAAGMADKGVDLTLARQNIPLLEADPRVKAAADELHAFYRRLLDDRLANGLLDQAQYDAIVARGDYYVPFVREWSVEQRPGTTGGGRLFNRSSGVRRMNPQEVASSAIVNPFKQAVLDAQSTARDIGRQRVMNTVGDILTAHPNEAAPYLVDHGPMATTPPLHASLQDRVITPVINGVKHRVEVTDPDLLASLQAQAPASESIFKKLLTVPKRLLQGGVTMHPEFGAANASRDAFFSSMQYHFPTASALTGTALGAGVGAATAEPGQRLEGAAIGAGLGLGAGVMAPHLLRTVQGLSHVLKYDDLYQQWLQAGGSGMGMYVKTPADAQRLVRRLTKQHGPLDILNPKSWWDGLQFVNEAIEQAPRVARFADELGKGASPTAAAASSRDISVDFSRRGGDPGVRAAADVTAFWNPNIQGLDKVRRTLFSKNSAKAWAMGAATMTAPSLALFAINKDDPAYWDRPLWERNLFWLVPAGQLENGETRFIRVPKPFEPGYIFASIPERLAEFAYQRDPERTSAALRDMVGNTLGAFVPVPTAIKPVAEAVVNYDTFRRRPVVPQGLENLPASRQVLPQTSVAARAAGAIGEAVGVPISPLKTDHVIRGLTGPLGAGALEAVADPVARLVGLDRGPQPPARPLVEWSRFVTKPNGFGTDDVQTMFRRFDRAEQWHTDITRRATAGDPTVGDVVRAHREDLLLYTQLKPFVSAFRDLSAARRAVTASRTMNPDEKRAALLQLGEYAAELATKAVNGMSGQVPRRVPPPGTDQPTTIPLGGR